MFPWAPFLDLLTGSNPTDRAIHPLDLTIKRKPIQQCLDQIPIPSCCHSGNRRQAGHAGDHLAFLSAPTREYSFGGPKQCSRGKPVLSGVSAKSPLAYPHIMTKRAVFYSKRPAVRINGSRLRGTVGQLRGEARIHCLGNHSSGFDTNRFVPTVRPGTCR